MVPCLTLFKNCWRNFDLSKDMVTIGGETFCTVWTSEKFFKILLLWNRLSDFKIISQDCSLGDPFQKCLRNFDPSKTWLPWGGNFLHTMDLKKFFKILLLWNRWLEFGIISQDCCLGDPFQKLFVKFGSVEKHGGWGWGAFFFLLCGYQSNSLYFFSSGTACQILK